MTINLFKDYESAHCDTFGNLPVQKSVHVLKIITRDLVLLETERNESTRIRLPHRCC